MLGFLVEALTEGIEILPSAVLHHFHLYTRPSSFVKFFWGPLDDLLSKPPVSFQPFCPAVTFFISRRKRNKEARTHTDTHMASTQLKIIIAPHHTVSFAWSGRISNGPKEKFKIWLTFNSPCTYPFHPESYSQLTKKVECDQIKFISPLPGIVDKGK